MAALLGSRLLVFDVVARYADFDEAPDEIPHVGVSPVAGVGVRDDEGAKVDLGKCRALRFAHAQTCETLVPTGREQGPNDRGGPVGHLAQRIARKVGARILRDRSLGGGRPAAQIDGLDARALERHGLAGRVGTKRGDLFAGRGQFLEPRMELFSGDARHRVVRLDRAPLLGDLARRVEPGDSVEPRVGQEGRGLFDFSVEQLHALLLQGTDCRWSKSRFAVMRAPVARN